MKNLKNYCTIAFAILLLLSCSDDDKTVMDEITDSIEETGDNDTTDQNSITNEILRLVNIHRKSIGLATLQRNTTADELAVDHTKYMISINAINHDNFNQRTAVLKTKENANGFAENVARFQKDAASVVQGWLNSDGHKENIEGNYTHIGIAAIKDAQGRYYYTQLFYR